MALLLLVCSVAIFVKWYGFGFRVGVGRDLGIGRATSVGGVSSDGVVATATQDLSRYCFVDDRGNLIPCEVAVKTMGCPDVGPGVAYCRQLEAGWTVTLTPTLEVVRVSP